MLPGLLRQLKDPDPELRARATDQIRGLGIPHTKDAVPHLIANFEDENEKAREYAAQAVAFYGADALPGVMDAARSDSPRRRAMAFVALGGFPGEVKQMVVADSIPLLAKGLEDENPEVRRHAATALRFHGSMAKATVPLQVSRISKEKDRFILGMIIKGLGEMGPDAKEALPVLKEFAAHSDDDPQLREVAARAIVFIEGRDMEEAGK
jgi:HEAT repeat protein